MNQSWDFWMVTTSGEERQCGLQVVMLRFDKVNAGHLDIQYLKNYFLCA